MRNLVYFNTYFRAEANPVSPPFNLSPNTQTVANTSSIQTNQSYPILPSKGRSRKRAIPIVSNTITSANCSTPITTNLTEIQKSQKQPILSGSTVLLDYNWQQTSANLIPASGINTFTTTTGQFLNNQQFYEHYSLTSSSTSTPHIIPDNTSQQMPTTIVKKIQRRRNTAPKNISIVSSDDILCQPTNSSITDTMNDTIEQVVCQQKQHVKKQQQSPIGLFTSSGTIQYASQQQHGLATTNFPSTIQKRRIPAKKSIAKSKF